MLFSIRFSTVVRTPVKRSTAVLVWFGASFYFSETNGEAFSAPFISIKGHSLYTVQKCYSNHCLKTNKKRKK